jgi:steroid 5-alpha reductase family enzyme
VPLSTLLLVAWASMALMMLLVWLASIRMQNAGIVDIAWALGFSILATLAAALGDGWTVRRVLVAAMVLVWSLRLGSHLYARVMGQHPVEDGRYRELRREWAGHVQARFFAFFQLQAILDVILAVPVFLACRNPEPRLHPLEWAGFALWLVALLGEATADLQLQRFKADPAHRGSVCRRGLWRYSRHPNYFFEWLVWCAYALFASASPWGWITLYCPLLMLYFLYRVTGIPATEGQALRSRGEGYREYQRTTSAFLPWPPRA